MIASTMLSSVLASRWNGAVEEDEHDRKIMVMAADWGRGALIFCIVSITVMLSFTPASRLKWATPPMIGNVLISTLMWGWLREYAAMLAYYSRDRTDTVQ